MLYEVITIKQDQHTPRFQISDHAGQLSIKKRFANAMQNSAFHVRKLLGDSQEVFPGQCLWFFIA